MTRHALIPAIALAFATGALASGNHDHGEHHKPLNGGVVAMVNGLDYELVAKPATIQLYLRDHGKNLDVSKASARVTLLTGSEKQEVELKPAGNRFEATGSFKVGPGTQAVAVVTLAGKASTARFTIP